jgi:hypothetical protein
MTKVLITQSNYIPWKGYFDAINFVQEFVIYDDVQYTRRDWRNRNKIKTYLGPQWLSIPVEVKGKFHQKINETLISEKDWGRKHWQTIVHNYSKAQYFNDYRGIFENAYLSCAEQKLSEINYNFIKTICGILNIKSNIRWSDEFNVTGEKSERLVAICKLIGGTDYFTGPAAKSYIDEELFRESNINLHYLDYSGYPEYRQLHGKFDHYVTILDLIFNEGPNAAKFMKSFQG